MPGEASFAARVHTTESRLDLDAPGGFAASQRLDEPAHFPGAAIRLISEGAVPAAYGIADQPPVFAAGSVSPYRRSVLLLRRDVHGAESRSTAQLRALALYGLREFSTFRSIPTGGRAEGETALLSAPLDPHADDPWLGFDKAQHLAFSFLWTLGTQYVAVNKGNLSESQALPLSIGMSAAVGVSKELYDLHSGPPNLFSYRDLVADGVGILLAVGIILL